MKLGIREFLRSPITNLNSNSNLEIQNGGYNMADQNSKWFYLEET